MLCSSKKLSWRMEKKLGLMFFLFVLLLLLQLSKLQGVPHVLQDQEGDKKGAWAAQEVKELEMTQGFSNLMGEEKCEETDEECMERRMLTESHLDYIYTQSHNKP